MGKMDTDLENKIAEIGRDVDEIKKEDKELEALRNRAMKLEKDNGRLRTMADQISYAVGLQGKPSEIKESHLARKNFCYFVSFESYF